MNYLICFGFGVMIGGLYVTFTKTKSGRDAIKKRNTVNK